MQFVATQMMSAVWNGPSTSKVMKPSVRRGNDSSFRSEGKFFFFFNRKNLPEFDKNNFINWNFVVGSQNKNLSIQGKGND